MNAKETRDVGALKALKLRDIQLFGALFDRPEPTFAEEQPPARQEHMRGVQYVQGEASVEERPCQVLQFLVHLGTRVVKDVPDEDPPVFFRIEATFLIEYEIVATLDEEAIRKFANFNAIHNAWPFWRQHVYDITQRARLPHLDIPLFAGDQV